MSKERYCPECGTPIPSDERFCPNCGTEIQNAPNATVQETETASQAKYFGNGSRTNIAGGLTQHQESHHTVNTSHVDNSQIIHSTTIVKDEVEYCEVCGNALEERHARCPKCGKIICLDCRVPKKNRCLECEEKAVNEYRISVRELLLSTGGQLDNTSLNLLNQKARELNLADKNEQIIQDVMGAQAAVPHKENDNRSYSSQAATLSPTTTLVVVPVTTGESPAPTSRPASQAPSFQAASVSEKKGSDTPIYALLASIVLVGILWLVFAPNKSTPIEPPHPETTSIPAENIPEDPQETTEDDTHSVPITKAQKAIQASSTSSNSTVSSNTSNNASNATLTRDAHYEEGMAAYKVGDGLNAIQSFEKSGSALSNYMLGIIYENGCGSVGANAMKAKKYFKKAASQGSTEARAKL